MFKKLSKIGFVICAGVVFALTLCAIFLPDTYRKIIPYRFHYVLTNSMEPTITPNSLVLVKTCDEHTQIEKDDILVFLATRFGEKITIMHRFSHTETNENGELVYKTHPEGSEIPDIYETKREDILGIYLWHIPYVGKLVLFLKSAFGWIWICEIILISLIRALLLAKWEEKSVETNRLISSCKSTKKE